MFWPHVLRGRVEKEYARVARGYLVVADPGVAKAADHQLVAAVQEKFTVDVGLPFQVAPHSDLWRNDDRETFSILSKPQIYKYTQGYC